jgi:hypothetical protein
MCLRPAGILALLCIGGTACYHATITTGRPASSDSISIPWANSFVYGLVPPPLVDAAAKCPNGVARVETQHSFLNGLVQFITLGIYTPIQIDVTCAAPGPVKTSDASTATPVLKVGGAADSVARLRAMNRAAAVSDAIDKPVFVQF